jgi:hypothetical protein
MMGLLSDKAWQIQLRLVNYPLYNAGYDNCINAALKSFDIQSTVVSAPYLLSCMSTQGGKGSDNLTVDNRV